MTKVEIRHSGNFKEIFIDGNPVEMGEGTAMLQTINCKIHGEQPALFGYNQGGHDGVDICLKCCQEIVKAIL